MKPKPKASSLSRVTTEGLIRFYRVHCSIVSKTCTASCTVLRKDTYVLHISLSESSKIRRDGVMGTGGVNGGGEGKTGFAWNILTSWGDLLWLQRNPWPHSLLLLRWQPLIIELVGLDRSPPPVPLQLLSWISTETELKKRWGRKRKNSISILSTVFQHKKTIQSLISRWSNYPNYSTWTRGRTTLSYSFIFCMSLREHKDIPFPCMYVCF